MLDLFTYDGSNRSIKYIETMQVKDGVECDVYSFINDGSQDLAIVRVDKAASTPRQKVIKGTRTIEGIVSGAGKLTIEHTNGTNTVYMFSDKDSAPITVRIGEIMQWTASGDTDLVFYEICSRLMRMVDLKIYQIGLSNPLVKLGAMLPSSLL